MWYSRFHTTLILNFYFQSSLNVRPEAEWWPLQRKVGGVYLYSSHGFNLTQVALISSQDF